MAKIRAKLGIVKPATDSEIEKTLSIEERKKLSAWPASYELAKIAKQEGVDLSKLSREEYVEYAIKNRLRIDDTQLRIAPWQRMATSVEEVVLENRKRKAEISDDVEKAFAKFSYEMKQKAEEQDRVIAENIRVRQGTRDSNSWLFFGINQGRGGESVETYKSYVSIKDLNKFSPEKFKKFMEALRDAGYSGDIKTFQDLSEQGIKLNDQIVMHGKSKSDAELGLKMAEQFFGEELDQKSVGKDEVVDGKNKSYSEILADKIRKAVDAS